MQLAGGRGGQGARGTLQALSLGLPIDEAPKSRSPRKEVWLGLGQGRPRSGWQEGRGQKGHPGGGGLRRGQEEATLPWAFLSAFPGVQPLSSLQMPPSGCWGRGELLAPGPLAGILRRAPPAPRALGRVWGRVSDTFGVTLAEGLLPPSGLRPSCWCQLAGVGRWGLWFGRIEAQHPAWHAAGRAAPAGPKGACDSMSISAWDPSTAAPAGSLPSFTSSARGTSPSM